MALAAIMNFQKRNGNHKQCFVPSKYNTANVLFHFVHIMRKNTEIKKAKRSNWWWTDAAKSYSDTK